MRLLVFFIYFASWELFIIGPDENCSFPAFFDCVNKVAFNNLYCFFLLLYCRRQACKTSSVYTVVLAYKFIPCLLLQTLKFT